MKENKKTKTRTRLTPEARKNQLLDVSKQMIIGDGLQAFSLEALARAAEVSSPLVYKYFDSRVDTLQSLLVREYDIYVQRLTEEVAVAENFEAIVRLNIVSNFDHYAPGNIIPILESQPEIAIAIRKESEKHGQQIARYLVRKTANTYNLTPRRAELVVSMSSGASIAAAQYAALGRMNRAQAIDLAFSYIMAGMSQAASDPA
ncbi:MAG: TetR/AcrR family transcriptional regulator [Pseudomonadota bacterium]